MEFNKHNIDKNVIILVTEDEDEIRESLVGVLKQIYTKVYHARNGLEAVDVLNEVKDIDVVITDINMPHMCGNDLIKYITEHEERVIPIIITSAYGQLSEKYRDIECIRVADKPYSVEAIIRNIEQLVSIKDSCTNRKNKALARVSEAITSAKGLLQIMRQHKAV